MEKGRPGILGGSWSIWLRLEVITFKFSSMPQILCWHSGREMYSNKEPEIISEHCPWHGFQGHYKFLVFHICILLVNGMRYFLVGEIKEGNLAFRIHSGWANISVYHKYQGAHRFTWHSFTTCWDYFKLNYWWFME